MMHATTNMNIRKTSFLAWTSEKRSPLQQRSFGALNMDPFFSFNFFSLFLPTQKPTVYSYCLKRFFFHTKKMETMLWKSSFKKGAYLKLKSKMHFINLFSTNNFFFGPYSIIKSHSIRSWSTKKCYLNLNHHLVSRQSKLYMLKPLGWFIEHVYRICHKWRKIKKLASLKRETY
jgi:hypothetical protein